MAAFFRLHKGQVNLLKIKSKNETSIIYLQTL